MKKVFLFLLGLSLVLSIAPAFAQAAPLSEIEYITYEDVTGSYMVDYPAEWMVLDKATIDSVIEMVDSGEASLQGVKPEAFEMMKPAIAQGNLTGFVDWSGANFSINFFGYPTPPDIEAAIAELSAQLADLFESVFLDWTPLDAGSVYHSGGLDFMKVEGTYAVDNGSLLLKSLFYFKDGIVYQISFTSASMEEQELLELDAIFDTIAASFALIE